MTGNIAITLTTDPIFLDYNAGEDLVIDSPIDTNGQPLIINGAGNTTITGQITGGGSLTMQGTGTLLLTNDNQYSGNTTISAGTIQDGTNDALPTGTNLTVSATGTLDLNGSNQQLGSLTGVAGATVTDNNALASSVLTVGNTLASVFAGTITDSTGGVGGTGSLSLVSSAGTLTLSGTNSYAGGTTIDGGITVINTANSLGTQAGSATINNAILEVHGNITEATRGFTLGNATSTIQVDSGDTYTIGGTIGGGGGTLNKTGAGTLVLGAVNNYAGSTTVAAGMLQDGVANALPTGTSLILGDGGSGSGVFDLNGNDQSVASIATSGAGTSNTITDTGAAATLTVNASGTDTYGGLLTGNLALTMAGSGTLLLTHANNYGGQTTVSSGTLQDGVANALPTGTSLVLGDGISGSGTFDLNGKNQTVGSITTSGTGTSNTITDSGVAATLTVNTTASDLYDGTLAGNLLLTKTGAGILTLAGAGNTNTGLNTVNGGELDLNVTAGSAIGAGGVTVTAGTLMNLAGDQIDDGATVTVNDTWDMNSNAETVAALNGSGSIVNDDSVLTVSGTVDSSFSGTIDGYGGLTKSGSATLTLSGANSYVGATTVASGSLKVGALNTLPVVTDLTLGGTGTIGTLDLNGNNQRVASISTSGSGGTITSAMSATLTVNNSTADVFDGLLTGNMSLTKINTGTLTLNAANNYTGATTVRAGTVVDGVTNALPVGTNLTLGFTSTTGALDLNGNDQTVASITTSGLGGTITSATLATLTVNNSAADTFGGLLTGNMSLTKTNTGTLTLNAANDYLGATTISAGAVKDGIANALPATTNLTLGGTGTTGTLDLNSHDQTVASITTSGSGGIANTITSATATTLTVNNSTADTFGGLLTGNMALTKTSAGVLTLGVANNYTGSTAVNGGALQDGVTNALPAGTSLAVGASGTFDLGGFNQEVAGLSGSGIIDNTGVTAGNFTVNDAGAAAFSGTIQNTGGNLTLDKKGVGTLTLSGNNTYDGGTAISAGTLLVNNTAGSATGTGTVTVSGNATLGGNGTVSGDIIVQSGGTVSPGNSAGILTTGGSATFAAGATYYVELNGTGNFDQLVTTGDVTLGNSTLHVSPLSSAIGNSFEIINNGSGDPVSGTFDGLTEGSIFSVSGRAYQITYVGGDNNDVVLTQVAAPTTTTLTPLTPNYAVEGATVTFTATVSSTYSFGAPLSGTVTFEDGGTSIGAVSISSSGSTGTATFTTSTLAQAAIHPITAVYGNDPSFADSPASNAVNQTVKQLATTTVISSSTSDTSVFGEPVTFTATVAGDTAVIPTGTVTFLDNGQPMTNDTSVLDANGTATYTTSSLAVSPTHVITVTYSGDSLSDVSSGSVTQTVTRDTTSTTISSTSSNPSVYGQPVTFTAVVTADLPGFGTPTSGTVTFEDGGSSIGTASLGSGTATFSTVNLNVPGNTHIITAVYNGDTNFSGGVQSTNSVEQVVTPDSTTTTVTSSTNNASVFGQSVTFTATVTANDSPSDHTPTGTATFILDGTTEPTVTLDSTGQATFATTFTDSLSVTSSHTLTVTYSGDDNFFTSGPETVLQTVNKACTTTTVTSAPNSSTFGQSVSFTATVSAFAPGAGTATGTVTFEDNGTVLASGTLSLTDGAATYTTTDTQLAGGSHSITVIYAGDDNFLGSDNSAAAFTQTVGKAGTTTTVTGSSAPSPLFGESVTFTATVTARELRRRRHGDLQGQRHVDRHRPGRQRHGDLLDHCGAVAGGHGHHHGGVWRRHEL